MSEASVEPPPSGTLTSGLRGTRGCLRVVVPGLLDVLVTSDPEQIRWLNEHPDVTRPLDPGASVLHRLLAGKLHDLEFENGVLPVFVPREDSARGARTAALAAQIDGAAATATAEREEIAEHIAGRTPSDLGRSVQQWCGRLFAAAYRATPELAEAGRVIAEWPSAPPWKAFALRRSGRLARAKAAVLQAAAGDLHCVHGTSIGMNNILRTVRELARVAHLPEFENASADRALSRCLVAPPAILRGCRAQLKAPFLSRPLTRRTLVVFLLARAYARSGDLDIAFLSGTWSGCPASRVIPEMLRDAWHTAHEQGKAAKSGPLGLQPWKRALMRAVSAFEGRAS